ncbi:MAG TPA: pitrilysin family protein, partial [Tepidisphaeraceae bacterium]|nr:pitrilysin family protein [Tepidisphaeraceae bacterium]
EDLARAVFTAHSYRWTPIGNMEHLRNAAVSELQAFFNTYYLPNNATLVIAGDIDIEATRELVRKYFGWIPKGPEVRRQIPQEPGQTESRTVTVDHRVALPAVMVAWKLPPYRSDDHYALSLLSTILGGGNSSRLDRLLVHGERPLAVSVTAGHMQLEDAGTFSVTATALAGRDPVEVEKALASGVAEVVGKGITAEELEKAKTQYRVGVIEGRKTAENLASQLGQEAVFGGDANRVNTDLVKTDAVTVADVQAVARKYLRPNGATTLRVRPDPTGVAARKQSAGETAAAQASAADANPKAEAAQGARPRVEEFPPGYPTGPMMSGQTLRPKFAKGEETTVGGVRVIVMSDRRLPQVNWGLTLRHGSHSDPEGKEGLASLTGDMLRRGAGDLSYERLNVELESRGISLGIGDGGDYTRLGGSSPIEQAERGLELTRLVLTSPTFPADEFRKLKEQAVNSLNLSRDNPRTVAGWDLYDALYGDSPLGAVATPESVASVTLDDVKRFYATHFRPNDAILVISGDVTVEWGRDLAARLLSGWADGTSAAAPPDVRYDLPPAPAKRRILLVDHPAARQSVIRIGNPAYTVRSDEKFAGSLASQILSSGIGSRLGKYVRAEKGLAYGVRGVFEPGRQAGAFVASTDTAVESTADAVLAIFKVLDDMRSREVTAVELAEAKTRTVGGMVMGMQTIEQQAGYRVSAILNGYPPDYYDVYPQKIEAVTASQVRDLLAKYVDDGRAVIVVVGPAEQVRPQLEKLGEVHVVPMPAKREGAKDVGEELLKKAA